MTKQYLECHSNKLKPINEHINVQDTIVHNVIKEHNYHQPHQAHTELKFPEVIETYSEHPKKKLKTDSEFLMEDNIRFNSSVKNYNNFRSKNLQELPEIFNSAESKKHANNPNIESKEKLVKCDEQKFEDLPDLITDSTEFSDDTDPIDLADKTIVQTLYLIDQMRNVFGSQ